MNCKGIISGEPLIEIERKRYDQLLRAETVMLLVKQIAEKDTGRYGYCDETSKSIDNILQIDRSVKDE